MPNADGLNLLHQLIRRQKSTRKPASTTVLALVDRLVIDAPNLFTDDDGDDQIPILQAAKWSLEILFRVINLVIRDSIRDSLKILCTKPGQICPLNAAIDTNKTEQLNHEKAESFEPAKATQVEPDNAGGCLHGKIDDKKLLEMDDLLRKTLYTGLHRREKVATSCLSLLMAAGNFDRVKYIGGVPKIPLDEFSLLLNLCPEEVFKNAGPEGYSPLQMAIRLYNESAVDYGHLYCVIEKLVDRLPDSIYFKATSEADRGKNVYQLLKELDKTKKSDKKAEDQRKDKSGFAENEREKSLEKVEELLKKACIGAAPEVLDLDGKLKFLYWDNAKNMRKIGLNLLGEETQLNKDYVSKAKRRSEMLFETILASVQLPYWDPQIQKIQTPSAAGEQTGVLSNILEQSKDPYIGIFEWLREKGVKKIFQVDVDDTGPEPHSNAAIRQSLGKQMPDGSPDGSHRDFEVEVFKWKKYDICSDTVYAAVPKAKEVHLYSSGNTAILRGWACSSGLHKMENVSTGTDYILSRNTNDLKDCEAYKDELKTDLAKKCPQLKYECIEIHYPSLKSTQKDSKKIGEEGQDGDKDKTPPVKASEQSPGHWIERMDPFINFINRTAINLPEDKRPTVKVAVLDDGVSLDNLNLNGGQGDTCRVDNVKYWVGPCPHGTRMVKCIQKLCPDAELYVARLDDSGMAEKKQKFTTESCFKALEWARKMDVDIISMSWTFKKKPFGEKDNGEDKFVTELSNAVTANNVILFASLPDKGATAEITDYLPVGFPNIIKIGSSTVEGEEDKEIIWAKRDFLLPGVEISESIKELDRGSSYATAYAAGLAALILYYLRTHKALEDFCIDSEDSEDQLAKGHPNKYTNARLEQAKTMDGMRKIFKFLSGKNANDKIGDKGFFVRPYLKLGSSFIFDDEQTLGYMRDLNPQMLPTDGVS
ncbi:hypothetical protein BGZ57DRAFT_808682 [Hyaloscypha finlandica]|nr:hypothetical protein BGZ57DRAFT_808682 [Hyaloscypha finlandica]